MRSLNLSLCHFFNKTSSIFTTRTSLIIPSFSSHEKESGELMVVVGGGAAGIYGAIRAKTLAPNLNVLVIEKGKPLSKCSNSSGTYLKTLTLKPTLASKLKVLIVEKGKPLSKVKISGGGRCNVTNGHCTDNLELAEHYPRGNKELKGSFFHAHGPRDTMSWFSDQGVELKTEDDGRVFPISNSSSSIIDCLMSEVKRREVKLETGKAVTSVSTMANGKFRIKIEKRSVDYFECIEANYLLIASGSSKQGYTLATQLGHSIVEPMPSLFTFKIEDPQLAELSGVTFSKVKAKLKLESSTRSVPQLTQVGPMLVTHWGLSGPVILRLSAWGARELFSTDYKGILSVDFAPDIHIEDVKSILVRHKNQFSKQKVLNSYPPELCLVKRFWKYILDREDLNGDIFWASISTNALLSVASLLKNCPFRVKGKGVFKDEFVTAGGVPLSEIILSTMESKIQPRVFFAGEVLNVDGVTGGFNFQNAWSGGYIAGTSIGSRATTVDAREAVAC